jgi:hypothetical protein
MEHQWTRCYRMRPYFRNVGLICTVFFAVVGLVSTLVAYFNIDGSFARPKLAALIFGLFWSAFTFLGIWLLLLYYRYRLFVNDSSLRQIGVLRDSQMDMSLVDELRWRRFPKGGSVRMSGVFGVLKIELGNFSIVNREELVAFLRQAISENRQIGWQQFNEQLADTPDKRKRSRRARILLALVFGGHAIAFGIVWAVGRDLQYLVMSGVNAVVAAYLIRVHLRDQTVSATHAGEQSGEPEPPTTRVLKS